MADQISSLTVEVNTKGTDQAKAALGQLGVNARKAEASVKKYKEETQRSTKAQKAYAKAQEQSNAQVSQAATVHKQARGGFRAMRGATQQLSYQLQDVAVQAQAGTDGLRILAQQGPQILSIFGPAGAITGAIVAFGALIGSTLVTAFEDAEESTDFFDETLDRLNATMVRASSGAYELAERIQSIAQRSTMAATAELIRSQNDARNAFKGSSQAISALLTDFDSLSDNVGINVKTLKDLEVSFNGVQDAGRAAQLGGAWSVLNDDLFELQQKFGLLPKQAAELIRAVNSLDSSDLSTYQTLRDTLDSIVNMPVQGTLLTDNFFQFNREVNDSVNAMEDANEQLRFLRHSVEQVNLYGVDAFKTLTEGSEEYARKQAELEKRSTERSERELDRRLFQRMRLNSRLLNQAERQAEQQLKTETDLQRMLNQEQDKNAEIRAKNQQRADELMARARTENAVIFAEKQRVLLDLEQARQILSEEQFLEYRKAMLEEFAAWKAEYHQREADRAALELAKQLEAQKTHLDRWKEQTAAAINDTSLLATSMAISLEQSMAGAFEGFLTGTMNAKEAFKEFVKGMLKSFLQAIAQMIAKRMALAVVEKVTGKAAAAGQAAYTGFISQSQVLMAGLNAFTSTAAIPVVGPALAPEAMATAIGVASPLAAGATAAAAAAAAARSTGGQVRGGQTYLVGEQGPELLSMGTSGRISSNDQLKQAMGGGESVQIVNNIDARGAGPEVETKIRQAMRETSEFTIAKVQDLMRRRRFV